jgi:hypothetical protein
MRLARRFATQTHEHKSTTLVQTMAISTTITRHCYRLLLSKKTNCGIDSTKPTAVVAKRVRCMSSGGSSSSSSSAPVVPSPPSLDVVQSTYKVVRRGPPVADGTGSREYLLLPPNKTLLDLDRDTSIAVAALLAHRNMIFGARAFHSFTLQDVCGPLVDAAVEEAGVNGDQPQAMAALHGLSKWVNLMLQDEEKDFPIPDSVTHLLTHLHNHDTVGLDAVRSIATGIPREGHSVVGEGTYRDGEQAWKSFASEYVELGLSSEASLYQAHGGKLVSIEHLADKNPKYMRSAGGAMARLFFV